jgi:hypothetical protein
LNAGIGGVTSSDKFYYAAALDKKRHWMRVTVDKLTGQIINVSALPRGAGAVKPEPSGVVSVELPVIEAPPRQPPLQSYYQPPPPHRRIGVRSFPYNSYGQPARAW